MEHVRIALNILGLPVIIRVAPHKFVLQDRFSKLMEDVLNVIHTQEQMLQERFVFHTTAMTDKNWAQMDHVLTAQIMREHRELV